MVMVLWMYRVMVVTLVVLVVEDVRIGSCGKGDARMSRLVVMGGSIRMQTGMMYVRVVIKNSGSAKPLIMLGSRIAWVCLGEEEEEIQQAHQLLGRQSLVCHNQGQGKSVGSALHMDAANRHVIGIYRGTAQMPATTVYTIVTTIVLITVGNVTPRSRNVWKQLKLHAQINVTCLRKLIVIPIAWKMRLKVIVGVVLVIFLLPWGVVLEIHLRLMVNAPLEQKEAQEDVTNTA
jgi:hypothetical protein